MLESIVKVLILTWSLTGFVCSVQVTMQNPAVNVTAGQNVTLYCTYSPPGTSTNGVFIQWTTLQAHTQTTNSQSSCFSLEGSSVKQCQNKTVFGRDARGRCSWKHQVYYFNNGQSSSSGNYKNRVTAYISPGNATITISNTQPQDTGMYYCEVIVEGQNVVQGSMQLTVLVAPSTPHCSMRGAVETGHYLSLFCFSEEGMPRPTYTWNLVDNGVLKPVPTNTNQQKGMLIVGNMSNFDDGYYRCTASNSLGNTSCELDLHTGGEAGIILAGVIGAVVVASIIAAVIWFVIAKNKDKKQKQATSEMKTMPPSGANTYAAVSDEVHEPARENLVASEPTETVEFHDQPENAASANGEMENPAV
ncbi:V-set and immunoglobulin domain-containing protein 1 isoform X1 [Spea bombifrons]|uniref:V-set and immunoglobulin domain-containing protein 1 isoform X1 n=1 Tax=Spea bombifrons TaxID=233779 RepID=UPI00234B8A3F|nr:V-set and immunoglobulin domain-containing protein 1 isoform X1 [Spea bombifrons]